MIRETIQISLEQEKAGEMERKRYLPPRRSAMASKGRPKVGVVLGSGGIKAFAAIPLFEFLTQAGVEVDLLAGCSGGSLICGAIGAGFTPSQLRELTFELLDRRLFERIDYRSVLGIASPRIGRFDQRSGILKPDLIRELYQRQFKGARLEDLRPRTLIQTTDLETGEGVVLSRGSAADAVYASGAFFPVLPPLYIDGRWLGDGVYSAPVPVLEAVKRNMDVIIALDFKERVTAEPQGVLSCLYRYADTTMETLKRSQMFLAIEMHHYEIIVVEVSFDRAISLKNVEELPFILDAGEKAIDYHKEEILSALRNFSAVNQVQREMTA